MRGFLVLAAVAACGGAPPPPPPAKVAAPPGPPPPPACIAVPEGPANVMLAAASGARLSYCVGGTEQCFAFDTETGALDKLAAPPAPAEPRARIVPDGTKLDVCVGQACKALPIVIPKTGRLAAATNEAGTLAVAVLGEAARGEGYAEIWDVGKARHTGTFRYARGDFRCGEVALLGDTIYIAATTCGASPAARAALYTPRGKKLANVGGRDFGAFGNAFAHVTGATWAFLEESGSQLAIQDVVTGKVVRTIDTSSVFKARGADMGNPGESALLRLADGTLALIAGAPATGSVALIDVAHGSLEIKRAPVCTP